MRLFIAALCALGLSSFSLATRYDLLALSEPQMRERGFLIAAGLVLTTVWTLLEILFQARRVKSSVTATPEAQVPESPAASQQSEELFALRTLVQQRDAERQALETALRDVEGRLIAEKAKKQESPTSADVEAQVVQVIARLQERGRFVDFLMQDVQTFSDEQVGRAARVVHQGCRTVLQELCTLTPVANDPEGQTVSVGASESARFRLVGSVSGEPPYRGRLLHRGWRTGKVNLPAKVENRSGEAGPSSGYVVVPAEVELSA